MEPAGIEPACQGVPRAAFTLVDPKSAPWVEMARESNPRGTRPSGWLPDLLLAASRPELSHLVARHGLPLSSLAGDQPGLLALGGSARRPPELFSGQDGTRTRNPHLDRVAL